MEMLEQSTSTSIQHLGKCTQAVSPRAVTLQRICLIWSIQTAEASNQLQLNFQNVFVLFFCTERGLWVLSSCECFPPKLTVSTSASAQKHADYRQRCMNRSAHQLTGQQFSRRNWNAVHFLFHRFAHIRAHFQCGRLAPTTDWMRVILWILSTSIRTVVRWP